MKLLWTIETGRAPIFLFGGGPPTWSRWHDPAVEALVAGADVFWNEIPEISNDDIAAAARLGIDSSAPLEAWLSDRDLERCFEAAAHVGANVELLKLTRPWLAAQILRIAASAATGVLDENAAESVLTATARRSEVPVYSEFSSPDDLFAAFNGLEQEAQAALLLMRIDEIELGAERAMRDAEAVASGSESVGESLVQQLRERYPALYGPWLFQRNQRWAERIVSMLDEDVRAFIYVGSAHLAGADSIQAMLASHGVVATRSP